MRAIIEQISGTTFTEALFLLAWLRGRSATMHYIKKLLNTARTSRERTEKTTVNHHLDGPRSEYSAILFLVLRSEEHTSELQSHVNLVCRLLLEKKKINDSGKLCE